MSVLLAFSVRVQYQEVTEPVFVPGEAVFDPANGFPYVPAPDATPRAIPALLAAVVAGSLFAPPFSAANVQQIGIDKGEVPWLAQYPDFARATPRVAEFPHLAYVPAVDRWGLDRGEVPWWPQYPDQLLPAPDHGRRAGAFAFVPDLPSFAVPELSWGPTYPEFARAAPQPVNEGGASWTRLEAATVPELSWEPAFPDFARRAPSANEWTGFFALVPDLPSFAVPELSWSPAYPDQPGRGPRPLDSGSLTLIAYVPAIDRWGLDAIPWTPTYPDFPGRGPLPLDVESLTTFAYAPAIDRWGLDAVPWLPTYPDFARAAPDANRWCGFYAFLPDLPSLDIPVLSWGPAYPDWHRRRVRMMASGQKPGTRIS